MSDLWDDGSPSVATPYFEVPPPSQAEGPPVPPHGVPWSPPFSAMQGPLATISNIHLALRDNEVRIKSLSEDIDSKMRQVDERLESATRRVHNDGREQVDHFKRRLDELEELVIHVHEEHEAQLTEERAKAEALKAQLESEQAAHRAALLAQQGQIDTLATAMRRQQEMLEQHIKGSDAQMKAVQEEASELHKAFKAQAAAVQATKRFIGSVDEKLAAQVSENSNVVQATVAAATAAWEVLCARPPPPLASMRPQSVCPPARCAVPIPGASCGAPGGPRADLGVGAADASSRGGGAQLALGYRRGDPTRRATRCRRRCLSSGARWSPRGDRSVYGPRVVPSLRTPPHDPHAIPTAGMPFTRDPAPACRPSLMPDASRWRLRRSSARRRCVSSSSGGQTG